MIGPLTTELQGGFMTTFFCSRMLFDTMICFSHELQPFSSFFQFGTPGLATKEAFILTPKTAQTPGFEFEGVFERATMSLSPGLTKMAVVRDDGALRGQSRQG